ncbi:MAG: hypothetical protein COS73_04515 [Nitrospirae bacterium CG06_land_8_20_14_3_00_70_43]|nr:MAG: hypothetical protein COS73_04515 [Nitrospirae bacterium CG06_land_8_20_14_3_00_70_43]
MRVIRSGQRSAVSGQRSAVSGQRSAVSGQRQTASSSNQRNLARYHRATPRPPPTRRGSAAQRGAPNPAHRPV